MTRVRTRERRNRTRAMKRGRLSRCRCWTGRGLGMASMWSAAATGRYVSPDEPRMSLRCGVALRNGSKD